MIYNNFSDINKKYSIIYTDPPWTYRDKALAGKRGACCKYNVMTIKELKQLPIQDICSDDCILFLWITYPKLNEVFDLIKAWGFKYKTVGFTWVKQNKKSNSFFFGMGSWTRANPELCLIATKGKIKRLRANIPNLHISRIEEHSKKPNEIRNKIIDLVGDLPRIELFARERHEGWDCFGNEVIR